MFWDSGYSNSENIDALLNKEDCALKELLDDEDILQECKSLNQKLIKFLNRAEIVDELVTLIVTEPPEDIEEKQRYLHPNVACEILTCDVPSLKQRLAEDPNTMNKLYSFYEQQPPLNPLLTSFVCKTFGTLIVKKVEQDWFLYQTICLQVLEFIKSKDNFLDHMLQHFSTPVVMDLLLNMLNDVEDAKMKGSFLEWINEKKLIERMIGVLSMPSESDKHNIIAQFLTELIKTGRCKRQNDTEDRKCLPNPLLQTLEDINTSRLLLDAILCESRNESGILSSIQVLLCLLENPIIQEPVSHTALQQMRDAEKEHHDEIVTSLMGIIQPRVRELFTLLQNPPSKHYPSALTPPLGMVRLQLCYLFTVLLETENTSIIEEICKTNFFCELLKLFKQYCWNNFLHNYVKRCLVYGIQAFDTIPNSTQLVISALQKHIVVDCDVARKLMDYWNDNLRNQMAGDRRLGYMGHLIDILAAIQSTSSVSEEFRALIENSLMPNEVNGAAAGEPATTDGTAVDAWCKIIRANDDELKVQNSFLADCDPTEQRPDYGRDGLLTGFPSIPDESENDAEEFGYTFNASMHGAMNGMMMMGDFPDDYTNDDDIDTRNKMFEAACSQTMSTFSLDEPFDNWEQHDMTNNQDFPFDFNNALNLKSTAPFDTDKNGDEQQTATTNNNDENTPAGFNSIIDNFADFDSHFADMMPAPDEVSLFQQPVPTSLISNVNPNVQQDANIVEDVQQVTETCFVATTQTIEISTAPPPDFEPLKREFQLGPSTTQNSELQATIDDQEEDEFYSLRDDSNEMNSLTDDNDKKLFENTEVPDDDDEFASADESSSKGNSEEETNSGDHQFVDCIIPPQQPTEDAKNEMHALNNGGSAPNAVIDIDEPKISESHLILPDESSKLMNKFAQAPDAEHPSELITPVVPVPLENGSA